MSIKKIWIISLICKFFDVATTYYFITKQGVSFEGNPIVRWSIGQLGLESALIINYLLFAIIAYTFYKSKAKKGLLAIAIVIGAVAIYNTFCIYWFNI